MALETVLIPDADPRLTIRATRLRYAGKDGWFWFRLPENLGGFEVRGNAPWANRPAEISLGSLDADELAELRQGLAARSAEVTEAAARKTREEFPRRYV